MNSRNFSIFIFSLCWVFFVYFSSAQIAHASYQNIAPGDTITLGEFVYDDNFVATTTACTVGITNPLNVEIIASTTPMTANNDGWHYYNYTTAEDAVSGIWPSVMICGSVQRGDLVIVDKSFIVGTTTSSLGDILLSASSSITSQINANTDSKTSGITSAVNLITESASSSLGSLVQTASSSIVSQISSFFADIPANVWTYISQAGRLASNVWGGVTRTLTSAVLDGGGNLATESYVDTATSTLTTTIQTASTSLSANINANTNSQVSGAISSINANTDTASSSIVSQISSFFAGIPANVWDYISDAGRLATTVWTRSVRTLTGAGLDSGSLATQSDVTGAVTSVNNNTNTASSSIASAITNSQTAINQNTDAQVLAASTSLAAFINSNSNATILAASTSLAAYLKANTDAASSSIAAFVNANTDSTVLAASTSLAAFINAHTDTQTSGIASAVNANTDASILSASTSLAAALQTASSSIVSQIVSYFAAIPANVWGIATSTLTGAGSIGKQVVDNLNVAVSTISGGSLAASEIWNYASRTLTGANLDSGSLATESYIDTATSTLTAEIAKGYTVTLSDFGETTVNTAYKAKLQVLNYASSPTDADSLPTVVITDPVGTVQVPAGVMTRESDGTYNYSYSINGSAVGGVWETVVSVVVGGETIKVNDYWSLSSSPADVNIIEISDKVIPEIIANVRIDNMGTSGSDFYYVYCIVNSEDNLCGGNDDIDSGSDTAYINAGDYINLSLTLDEVGAAGTYWFKVKARALAEPNWAGSSEQFIAESGTVTPPVNPSSGGGGGGSSAAVVVPTIPAGSCNGADFNGDKKVNSVDFSILLAFWQKLSPFKNPCVDINKDNKVNSVDFSILLYQWKK